jgi:microcompartment protein CcmK/EutM
MPSQTDFCPVFSPGSVMKLAKVIGNVVSTLKPEGFKGTKLLMVDHIDLDEKMANKQEIAIDMVDAGLGDIVLILSEGNSVRQLLNTDKIPVRTVVVGVVDHFDVE